jgi:hypothetical protein
MLELLGSAVTWKVALGYELIYKLFKTLLVMWVSGSMAAVSRVSLPRKVKSCKAFYALVSGVTQHYCYIFCWT